MTTPHDGMNPQIHRFLDEEPGVSLSPPDQASAERFRKALALYVSLLGTPRPGLDDTIMDGVRESRPRRKSIWRWFLDPQPLTVRPVVLALAALLVVALWTREPAPVPTLAPAVATSPRPGAVLVRFELLAPDANSVSLAGSFNEWRAEGIALVPSVTPGLWTVTVPLPLGSYEYLFVVDGRRWIADPSAHAQVEDGFGQTNSVIVVGPRGVVKS